jgi:outer membrane protein assembly factor BamA
MRMLVAAVIVGLCVVGSVAHADPISADDLAKKNEGGYVTGLPLAAYSTDIGLGGGARAYYYWNGSRDDPRFATTPYLFRMFVQAFASTRGLQFHWIDFDAPKLLDTPYRLRSQLIYARNINNNYFGLGSRSLAPLSFPGSKNYSSFSDYSTAEQTVGADGTTYSKYNQYDLEKPGGIVSLERSFLDDRIRALAGLGFMYAKIRDFSGKQVDALDANGNATTATMNQTKLAADCAAGLLVGCAGGRDNYLRLGISYDTRDYEPDPNTGIFLDAEVDLATVALGSQYDYVRAMIAARGYYSPIPDRADLVLAGRAVLLGQTNGAPFFSMDTFPFTEDPRQGLGGHRTLRGYRQDRFVGSVMSLVNAEVRWTFGHARIWGQKFAFIACPFFDVGRPYDSLGQLTLRDWKPSYGAALRISWNLATLATIDYGVSPEDTGLYINFNHIF